MNRNRHKFIAQDIPPGQKRVAEFCEFCGCKRFKSLRPNGKTFQWYYPTGSSNPCPGNNRVGHTFVTKIVRKKSVETEQPVFIDGPYGGYETPLDKPEFKKSIKIGPPNLNGSDSAQFILKPNVLPTENFNKEEEIFNVHLNEEEELLEDEPVQDMEDISDDVKLTLPLKDKKTTTKHIFQPNLSDYEAKIKDACIIIRVMYEDLVKNGLMTTGRKMAGRFLYSQGYEQLVKYLDNKK